MKATDQNRRRFLKMIIIGGGALFIEGIMSVWNSKLFSSLPSSARSLNKDENQKLAKQTKVVGVMGNHDLQIGYKVLEDVVTFAEREKEVKVEGLTIKGAINTNDDEIPGIYGNELVQQVLGRYFVNYAEGSSDMSNEAVAKANKDTYEK